MTGTEHKKIWFVSLGCLLGVLASSYFLYQDIRSRGARTGTPMAKLERTESNVRLKSANSFVWNGIETNESLYLKDSLQTTPQGAAAIRFNDGSLLEMGENSLIIIDTKENLSLSFVHGTAVLRGPAGDSRISVGADGKTQVVALPTRLLKPEPLSEMMIPEKTQTKVLFSWEILGGNGQAPPGEVTLQISGDRKFSSTKTQSFKLPGATHETAVSLSSGKFFWRILQGAETASEPGQFKIESIKSLKPTYPTENQKISVSDGVGDIQFRFVPVREDLVDSRINHRIDVSETANFAKIFATAPVVASTGIAPLKDLPSGKFFWRIVSNYKGANVSSRVESFDIEKPISLYEGKKTVLQFPTPKQEFRFWKDVPVFAFKWIADDQVQAGKATYVLEVASNAEFKNAVQAESQVPGISSEKVHLEPGPLFWRVSILDSNKRIIKSSGASEFYFGPYPTLRAPASVFPKSGTIYNALQEEKNFLVKWDLVEKAQSYELTLKSASSGKDQTISEQVVVENSYEFKDLKPGKYKYFVRAIDPLDRKGEPTLEHDFEVTYGDTLKAPEALSPEVQ